MSAQSHGFGWTPAATSPEKCAMSTMKIAPTASAICAETGEIDDPRIGAAAGDDHLGLVLVRQARDFVVIDAFIFFAHAVGDDLVELARKIERMAVRQVAAVRQVHAEDGVARVENAEVGALIRLRTGVRLHVGILGSEQFLGAVARQVLDPVREFAAAVIALARIAFGVFVGEDGAGGFENRFGNEVLAGDQFQARVLALRFMADQVVNFGIGFGQRARRW